MKITLPQQPWHGLTYMDLELPDDWQVREYPMTGAKTPALGIAEMEARLNNPIDCQPLSVLAQGKERVVIVFDDMTRPTRAYELVPLVLKELHEAGVREDQITFVCALGTHGALTMVDFRKKLGAGIVEKYRVFNHNIYENCVEVGKTKRGTRVMFNREVMAADLKIAIGCVTPHVQAGFSGGGKLFLPGVAHIDTISHYHLDVEAMGKETTGMGRHENNILREEINEASEMAGVDFILNITVNGIGETIGLFAGSLREAHNQAVEAAKKSYLTDPVPRDNDLVIANAFTKPNEMAIAMVMGLLGLKGGQGTVIVIAESPEGQVPHYLLGRFGRDYGGRQFPIGAIPPGLDLIVMTSWPDRTILDWFEGGEQARVVRNWQEAMALIGNRYGAGTSVAVLPNATMQYYG